MLARILPFKNDKAHIPIPTSSFIHPSIHFARLFVFLVIGDL